ncbi:MAG: pyruvate kinase, partial [Actinomycetota bacterium]|nr:pyruvate kinase [Actinomycetota bacterium]
MRRTKIVATLGPATSSEETIGDLVRGGVNVTRLNFSHGEHGEHQRNARLVREAAKKHGRNVAVLQDIQGPKIRTGEVEEGTELREGSRVAIVPGGDFVGNSERLSTSYGQLAEDVDPGDRLLIDDGLLGLRVEEIRDGEVVCEVIEGGEVSSHKGLNFPDTSLSIKGLTSKDMEDLEFGVKELKPDWIAISFVRSGDEVREVKERIGEFGGEIPVISKIEKHEAIEDIEDIMLASDGIMVARGDLAVELSNERVPIEQKRLVARCRRLGKPVIVATQMLDSMMRNPRPTRAEVSDVANAIFDRTDAVMLSGETAVGRYPLQSVREMDRICRAAEGAINYGRDISASASWGRGDRYDALTHAACELAEVLEVEAILTSTQSGLSCIRLARFRPPNKILA